ncbi:MAG TPA: IPT/TIG domain-containing protein [Thermoanaerobaculia bacterium]|nr:IPT/TIG domain-containing protein [Thermoanaerobaculia bacterium]
MSPIMKILITVASILVSAVAVAQEHHHDAELRKLLSEMSTVGTKSTVPTGVTVTVNMTARSFSFTPSAITVNQGDTLVINLSVPSGDESKTGHGLLMETYLTDGIEVGKGQTKQITIEATQDGVFAFACAVSTCGEGHSNMFGFLTVKKVTNPAPTVTKIAPTSGPTTGGTAVIITGTNFQPGATVTFGSASATSVTVTDSTSLVATTPAASAAGDVAVVVKNADGQSVSFSSFKYTLVPAINAVSPATGPTSGGTVFTISGAGFAAGATVTVGGRAAGQVNVVNSTTITALSPFGLTSEQAGLPQDVVVTNPDGTRITKTGAFLYTIPPLSVSTVSAQRGLPAGGNDVTISGAGFNAAVVSTVTFGGTAATNIRIINPITMIVTAPAHAAGTVDVVVTVGGASATLHNGYTYGDPIPRKRAAGH